MSIRSRQAQAQRDRRLAERAWRLVKERVAGSRYRIGHSREGLSLAEIAAACDVSPRALQRALHHFRTDGGQTTDFRRMVRFARLRLARELLREHSRITVSDVARQVGYGDAAALTKAYRRLFGITPAREREQASGHRRGGSLAGAALRAKQQREFLAMLDTEASYRETFLRSWGRIYDWSPEHFRQARRLAETRGLAAAKSWAGREHKARLQAELAAGRLSDWIASPANKEGR
jgi:AraC-like DNA-binding protein